MVTFSPKGLSSLSLILVVVIVIVIISLIFLPRYLAQKTNIDPGSPQPIPTQTATTVVASSSPTVLPSGSCKPRPACLRAHPPCLMMEPAGVYCD